MHEYLFVILKMKKSRYRRNPNLLAQSLRIRKMPHNRTTIETRQIESTNGRAESKRTKSIKTMLHKHSSIVKIGAMDLVAHLHETARWVSYVFLESEDNDAT